MSGASKSKKIVGEFLIRSVPFKNGTKFPMVGSVSSISISNLFDPLAISDNLLLSSDVILT